jgi:hypothetical protein
MKLVDDRTPEQKKTHNYIVLGTDSFMSGWGEAKNGTSYAGWACEEKHLNRVESWVRNRSGMKRVRIVAGDYKPPSINGHCHIYLVNENHPSI